MELDWEWEWRGEGGSRQCRTTTTNAKENSVGGSASTASSGVKAVANGANQWISDKESGRSRISRGYFGRYWLWR
jgi:hypothetical protein